MAYGCIYDKITDTTHNLIAGLNSFEQIAIESTPGSIIKISSAQGDQNFTISNQGILEFYNVDISAIYGSLDTEILITYLTK